MHSRYNPYDYPKKIDSILFLGITYYIIFI
ncbi:hypothetical protein SAMN05421823_10762 [Catalinimonas alkaloidigena]|uniref:Uncharacterized protein n=1 Tax=Catalinimonas alkaloidigena TaxID=1075417 RepID=A0A1G9LIQ8_9BACT|nr:hypothetical protein SAMN05421823_10762 [Catalinimonas alkaloidigena]